MSQRPNPQAQYLTVVSASGGDIMGKNVYKRINGAWVADKYYQYQQNAATVENSKTIPIYSDGSNLTDYSFEGQCSQASTPTPSSPVEVECFGDLIASGENAGKYDIPITSGGVMNHIILSEPLRKIGNYADSVDSEGVVTRRIGKYEITGQENWLSYPQASYAAYITLSDMMANGRANGLSSCFKAQVTPASSTIDGITFGAGANNKVLYITFSSASASALNITDITSIKTWLAQQYTNGTPVTVYYVLATPTTESYSKNIFTPAPAQTTTLNGVTCVSDGEGRYSFSGTATANGIIEFDIPEFTTPVSVGQGGNGTFSLFNNFAKDNVWFKLRNDNTEIDEWYCSTSNRRSNTYVAMGNKLINKIQIVFYSGVSFAPGSIISPMFSHDSTYPTAFEPYTLPPTIPTSSGYSNIEIGTSLAPSKFTYDLGKMFVGKGQGKVRQNGEWV